MAPGEPDGFTLTITRHFSAPPESVFDALVDPDQIAKWFGPHDFTVPMVDFTPRAGSGYRIELQPPEGDVFHVSGKVSRADRPTLLGFTFVYDEPSPDDVETHVELSLVDGGGSTQLHLTHGAFKTDDRRALHDKGWSDSLDKLARVAADPVA
jgi:uncharacterized protein YndB with AHSA1/START domain